MVTPIDDNNLDKGNTHKTSSSIKITESKWTVTFCNLNRGSMLCVFYFQISDYV